MLALLKVEKDTKVNMDSSCFPEFLLINSIDNANRVT